VRQTGYSRGLVRCVLRGLRSDIFRVREDSLELDLPICRGLTLNGRPDIGMGQSCGGNSRAKGSAAAFALSPNGPYAAEKRKRSMTAR
jgi:hypothetical protein